MKTWKSPRRLSHQSLVICWWAATIKSRWFPDTHEASSLDINQTESTMAALFP
jgi:hypothetical protein